MRFRTATIEALLPARGAPLCMLRCALCPWLPALHNSHTGNACAEPRSHAACQCVAA